MEGDDITYNNLDLYKAAGCGDVKYVKKALANKIDPNWQNPDWRQCTALHHAAQFNHSAVVWSLRDAGALMDLRNEDGETAIYMAAYAGKVDAVTALLRCCANIEIETSKGITPVMTAGSVKVVEALIDARANLEHVDDTGHTALHWAVQSHQSNIVKLLMQKGLDPRKQDNDGISPVDYAKKCGYHKLVTIMVGKDVEITELDLFNAAKRGDVDYVAKALAKKTDPNWQNPDEYHRTALHGASECNNAAVIKMLLAAGANKDMKDHYGCTPIYFASDIGSIEAVTMLLDSGADIEIADDGTGCTPVMIAYKLEVVKMLIDANANLRKANCYGQTALHLAVGYDELEIVKLLLQKGIDAMQKDEDGLTAAEHARKYDKHDLADIIDNFTGTTSTAPIEQSNAELDLCNAVSREDVEYVDKALANKTDPNWQNPDQDHRTALHQACRWNNSAAIARSLVAAGANKDLKDDSGETPLFVASNSGKIDVVNFLIDCGADIEIATYKGITPVMTACTVEPVEVVEALIDAHANLEHVDDSGQTALHLAVHYDQTNIVKLLMQKGLDSRKKDKNGLTPVDYAKERGYHEMVTIMVGEDDEITELDLFNAAYRGDVEYVTKALAKKIDPNWQNPDLYHKTALHGAADSYNPALIKMLLAAGANKDQKDKLGNTPLFEASYSGKIDAVNTLIDCGADIDIPDNKGVTPVMIAHPVEVVEALIDAHADLERVDDDGKTALHWVVQFQSHHTNIVKLLIQKGLDPRKQDKMGKSPVDYAKECGYQELVTIMVGEDVEITELDLFNAASRGDVEYVAKALDKKTDPNWQNPDDCHKTALHGASFKKKNAAVIKMLLAAGANKDLKNDSGETPLYVASYYGEIDYVNILIDCGADIEISTNEGITPVMTACPVETVAALIDAHANLEHVDDCGLTALHWAVRRHQPPEIVKLLTQKGLDPRKKDIMGLSPVDYAKERELHELVTIMVGEDVEITGLSEEIN